MTFTRRVLGAPAVIVSVALLTGCVLGTRQPTLHYPPASEPGAIPEAHAALKPEPKNIHIILDPFVDQRSDKKTVGTTRNAFGMKMADVVPVNSVPDWVMQGLKMELQNRGYVVTVGPAAGKSTTDSSAIVSGEILNVYCDMYLNYTGQVSLFVRVRRGGKDVLDKHYAGEGSAGLAWAATEESYAQSLALALKSAINLFLPDLDRSLAAQ